MMKDLKVIFMGTPSFSTLVLKKLIENTNIIAVVTQPDKIVGRKKEIIYSEVKKIALENNIPIFQPVNIKKEYQSILDMKPDIIITCAYGQIIPNIMLNYPKYGCINVHASLLPKLRGGAPIHHAILNGETKTGVTIMYMDSKMDTGDIISSSKININDNDNYGILHDKLSLLGANLLIETLPSIINKTNKRIKQDNQKATYAYIIKREDELLDFNLNSKKVYLKIKGLSPTPGSYFTLDNKIIKVYDATYEITDKYKNNSNGTIVLVNKLGFSVKTLDGIITITDLKVEGKKRMLAKDFINGNKNLIGKVLNI